MAPDRYELRPDARRFETWQNNYATRLGLGVAVDYAQAIGIEAIAARCRMLAGRLSSGLGEIQGVTIHDLGPDPAAIVTFSVVGHQADAVQTLLAGAGINVSTSDPLSTLLDAKRRALPVIVRASPHYYNTEEEIDRLTVMIGKLAARR